MLPIERPQGKNDRAGDMPLDLKDQVKLYVEQLSPEEIDAHLAILELKLKARIAAQSEIWEAMQSATDTETIAKTASQSGINGRIIGDYERFKLLLLQQKYPGINPHTYPGTK